MRLLKAILGAFAVLALAAASLAVWYRFAPRHTPSGQPPLTSLATDTLTDFYNAFNESRDETRVLAMFSPT